MTGQRISGDKVNCEHAHWHMKCISWTAIFVGALIAVGLGFLLNLFSVAISLSAYTTNTATGAISLAVGGIVGVAIGGIVSMFVAGFAAGYLGKPYCVRRNLGVVYGFATWCVALILMVMLTSQIGRYVTFYSHFISAPTIVATTQESTPAIAVMPGKGKSVAATVNASNVEIGTFVLFAVFFLGALGSCFGGHYGMTCRDDEQCR